MYLNPENTFKYQFYVKINKVSNFMSISWVLKSVTQDRLKGSFIFGDLSIHKTDTELVKSKTK